MKEEDIPHWATAIANLLLLMLLFAISLPIMIAAALMRAVDAVCSKLDGEGR